MNFNCGIIAGGSCDAGGATYYYLTKNPDLRKKRISMEFGYRLFCPYQFAPQHLIDRTTPVDQQIKKLKVLGFNDIEIKFLQRKPDTIDFYLNNYFLHYRAASNYNNQSQQYHAHKKQLVNDLLNDAIEKHTNCMMAKCLDLLSYKQRIAKEPLG